MAESAEQKERAHGQLTEKEQAEANKGHAEREDMPADVFLEPGARKYPVKEKRDGKWVYSRDLLLAAAREARMHGHKDLAERADAIRKREFDGAKDEALAFDRSVRTTDEDGRLHVALTPVSKATVNEYFGAEIPDAGALGLEAQRKYRLLRDPTELEHAAETANNVPLMIKHIRQSADDPQQDEVVGSLGTDAEFKLPYLKNSLIVWTRDAIDGIESGKRRQLSASYRYDADMTPGTYEGQPYDGVMRNIRFNHVALVEEGRAGPDVLVDDSVPSHLERNTMHVSRRAIIAKGGLAGVLRPLLANDAKLPDLSAVVRGVTAANWHKAKPQIVARLTDATLGKLAKDANLREVHGFLDSLDHEGEDQTEPDEMEVVDRRAKDAGEKGGEEKLGGFDETPEEKEERERKEREAKDRRARDESKEEKKAEDESEEEMKARHEKEAKDARDRRARDAKRARDESEEEKKEREEREERDRKEADDRRRASDKHAMDAAISAALTAERKRQVDIREAERAVRPWIGEITMAQDSAEAVYRLALDTLGVKVKDVHPSAFRAILEVQPKPGDRPVGARLAMDAAGETDFAKRFPNLAAVRHY